MLYFVPAWYKQNTWSEDEQTWYMRRMKSEFDETIKQITLFHRNVDVDYQIINLSFSPNFRHFLHRQSMYQASYWSCFDAITQTRRKKAAVLSYQDIQWPEKVEFVYSPFAIVAFLEGVKFAKIEFGEDGNPISVDMYENGTICRRNYYDDRGFVAGSVVYEEGEEQYQDYLMENGIWKIRQFFSDGHVEVNGSCPNYDLISEEGIRELPFSKRCYDSLDEVIEEVLTSYIGLTKPEDKFFAAAHPLHLPLLGRCLAGKPIVLTFFEDRFDYSKLGEIRDFVEQSSYIITDSRKTSELIKKNLGVGNFHITDISPYDTRMDFGISQQLKVQNILIPIDGIAPDEFRRIIKEVAGYLVKNELARVHLFSRDASWGHEENIRKELMEILSENGFDSRWALEESGEPAAENGPDTEEPYEEEKEAGQRFYIDICVDERTISKCINEQRIILDLRKTTDVFVFITAISKGVPRISMSRDQFFRHKKNGYLIQDYSEIQESISYYLDSLENWNEALVSCYEIGKVYTTENLIDSWRKVLEVV